MKTIILTLAIIMAFTTVNSQNLLFPSVKNIDIKKNLRISSYSPKGDFQTQSTKFSTTGEYIFSSGSTHFSNLDWSAVYTKSTRTLSNCDKVQLTISGGKSFPLFYTWGMNRACNSKILLDFYSTIKKKKGSKYYLQYQKINSMLVRNTINTLNKNGAKKIKVCFPLEANIDNNDSLGKNIVLHLVVEDIIFNFGKNQEIPQVIQYSLEVYNQNSEIIQKYRVVSFVQVSFEGLPRIKKNELKHAYIDATSEGALDALLNMFLNDEETYQRVFETHDNIVNSSVKNRYNEIMAFQAELYNITMNKKNILNDLKDLGIDISNMENSGQSFSDAIAKNYVPSSSAVANSITSSTLNLTSGIFAALDAKDAQTTRLALEVLKGEYARLDAQEQQLQQKITLANFPAFCSMFFPNNRVLNEAFQQEKANADVAMQNKLAELKNTSAYIASETQRLSAQNAQNSIQVESSAVTNSGSGGNNSFNTNQTESKACGDNTTAQWKQSAEYQRYMSNLNCNKNKYIADRKLVQMMLNNCRQYLPPAEIESYNKSIKWLDGVINSMEDCNFSLGK